LDSNSLWNLVLICFRVNGVDFLNIDITKHMLLLKKIQLYFQLFPKRVLALSLLIIVFTGFKPERESQKIKKYKKLAWSLDLPQLGTLSSPRATDLNGDGVLDLVMGVGRLEFQAVDTAIIAISGKTGELIWKRPAIDQIYGSATLLDINHDGVDEVLIGGRSATLQAINGRNGMLIWDFVEANNLKDQVQVNYFNFYNPQLIPDISGDGLPDIIISNGGDVNKAPYDPNRPTGKLLIIDASNGKLIKEIETPDKREIYHSVTLSNHKQLDEIEVVFGTGGETIGGGLYVIGLKDILNGNIKSARVLARNKDKGFIAPAVWADLNGDGVEDIIANAVDGIVYAFEGKTKDQLWRVKIPDTEIYSTPAIGHFSNEKTLDVFISAGKGIWPLLTECLHVMIDGTTGKIRYQKEFENYQSTSPLVMDINGDGVDEIIICENRKRIGPNGKNIFSNTIAVIDFTRKGKKTDLILTLDGNNMSSTPWIGDLDNDNLLDIVFSHSKNPDKGYAFDGIKINLLKTEIPITKPIKWGAYMGSSYTGRY